MINDSLLQFSAAQVFTTGANNSTNVIDLGVARDIGEGKNLFAHFNVNTTFTSGGSATLLVEVVVSASASLTTPTYLARSALIPVATLVAGYRFALRLSPLIGSLGLRYLGVIYTVGTADMTAGKIDADLLVDIEDGKKFYTSGFTVN